MLDVGFDLSEEELSDPVQADEKTRRAWEIVSTLVRKRKLTNLSARPSTGPAYPRI